MSLEYTSESAWPYKKDPELQKETSEIKHKYPFSLSTCNKYPLDNRFLLNKRAKEDFDDVNKYHKDNTPEVILEKER